MNFDDYRQHQRQTTIDGLKVSYVVQGEGMPLLLLWAEHDQFQPLASAQHFAEEFPTARLQVIAGSDHFLPLEKGQEVADALLTFLAT